jgi:uncharacterized membrane protein
MHGCEALSRGQPLRMGYLASGFLKSGGPLVAVGGLSLLGQFATALLIYGLGGEEMKLVASLGPKALADPANAAAVQEAMPRIAGAFLVGTLVSIPFLLATWFAPLLVFFDERKPLAAMLLSFRACVRNLGAFVLLGALLIAGLVLLMPLGLLTGELDLGLWLMAPILVPAIYVSYKDLFQPAPASNEPPMNADERR